MISVALPKIGFAGLGRMGAAMAPRLLDAGYSLSVWNRNVDKAAALIEKGARFSKSPEALVNDSEIIVSMLSDDASINRLFTGENGFLSGNVTGKLFIDMTTIRPDTVAEIAVQVQNKGAYFVDAPVSGTVGPAKDGKLLGLVGGAPAQVERAMPVLNVFCRRVIHAGPCGSGALLKLVVNLPLAVYWQSLAEAVALGVSGGLDQSVILDTIADSSAALAVLKLKTPAILGQPGPVAFDVASMQKDVLAMIQTASSLGVPVPSASSALSTYAAAAGNGFADHDAVAIVKFLAERLVRPMAHK